MPRPLRIEYTDAWHHVFNRGAAKQLIFFDDWDRKIFLRQIEKTSEKYEIEIHAYCLMDNHFHLLIKTPKPNLGNAMKFLQGTYTQLINKKLVRDGALLKGRYCSILVEDQDYLFQVMRYIHLNPLKANICKRLIEYKWSSYNCYAHGFSNTFLKTEYFSSIMKKEDLILYHNQEENPELIRFYRRGKEKTLGKKKL